MNRVSHTVLAIASLLLLAAPIQAGAQGLGLKGGITFATLDVDPSDAFGDEVKGRPGGLGGASVTFREGRTVVIEVAGQLAMRRISYGPDIHDTLSYVEVPVVARVGVYKIGATRISVLGGGSFNMLLKARESIPGQSFDVTDAYKSFEAAIVVGAHAELSRRLSAEVRYLLGSDAFAEEIEGFTAKQRGWQFIVGYRIR